MSRLLVNVGRFRTECAIMWDNARFFFLASHWKEAAGEAQFGSRGWRGLGAKDLQGRSETTPLIAARLSEYGTNSLPFFSSFPAILPFRRSACFLCPIKGFWMRPRPHWGGGRRGELRSGLIMAEWKKSRRFSSRWPNRCFVVRSLKL